MGSIFHGGGQYSGIGDYYSPADATEADLQDGDAFPFLDATTSGKRKTLWSNIKAKLQALFVSKTGDTMTGQIKTSFKSSVAMGSYQAEATTIPDLINEVRYSSGCCGSANITTAYSGSPASLPAGWYNFLYIPHRSGGVNGAASEDNCNYGRLELFGMTVGGEYEIRFANGSIAYCKKTASLNDLGLAIMITTEQIPYKQAVSPGASVSLSLTPITYSGYSPTIAFVMTSGSNALVARNPVDINPPFTFRVLNVSSAAVSNFIVDVAVLHTRT